MTTPDDPYAGQPAPEHGAAQPPATPPPHQQPAYYGTPAYYPPPAENPPNRGVWFAIGAGSMFALGVVGIICSFLFSAIMFSEDFDEFDDEDDYSYYYVDQRSVLNAIEEPCEDMIDAGKEIKPFDDPKKAAVGINAFAVTAQKVADAIGTASPDADSQLWRDDWESLAEDLETYADDLVSVGRNAAFTSLTAMGEAPLMFRMSMSSEADCEVPPIVVAFDTENAGTYSNYYY